MFVFKFRNFYTPFFQADGATGGFGAKGVGDSPPLSDSEGEEQDAPALTLDDALQDKGVQAEFDRRIAKALSTARANWEEQARLDAEEEKRLAKLSAEEKAAAKLESAQARVRELEAEKTAILLRQETVALLAERKLSPDFVDYILADDAESIRTRLDAFETVYRADVEAAVLERMKGKTPQSGARPLTNPTQGKPNGLFI